MRLNPVSPRSALFEPLEARQLCTITPAHLALAERSVAEVLPENNVYSNATPVVTWNGLNGKTLTSVSADCTTYMTVLLKQAYGWTNSQWTTKFGVSSPSLTTYYNDAIADVGLDGFKQISNAKPGDLFICKYPDGSSARGHMVMLETTPTLVSVGPQYRAYNVTILDVTGSPHSNDTRTPTGDTGIGRGDIRLYTDLDGNLSHWAWGTKSTSTTYDPIERPVTFAKIPALSILSPTGLAATPTGETSVNLTWTDKSTIEDGYVVQRSPDNGTTWTTIGDTQAGGTSFTDTTASPGNFTYRVYAVAGASQSGSSTATVSLTAVTPIMPTQLRVVASGANVAVSWRDNATNEARYVLERSTDGQPYVTVGTTSANATVFSDTTAGMGHVYTYRLHAESNWASSDLMESGPLNRATRTGVYLGPVTMGPTPVAVGTTVPPQVSADVLGTVPPQGI